jgi:uncharacterized membrane protein YjdF
VILVNNENPPADLASRIHKWLVRVLLAVMALEWIVLVYRGQWLSSVMVTLIIGIAVLPEILRKRLQVTIPAEFQVLAIVFVFAALFLGEVRSFYERIWWWDIMLHASSGLLLGIVGFLLVYVLNETDRVDLHMHPRFVALFAFLFAVAVGALWEIYEFGMDQLVGTNMQKPMLGDPSGLTDTMWDLIVDTLGAFAVSAFGWWYMKKGQRSFIEDWIHKFIAKNPRLFLRRRIGRRRRKV